MPLKIPNAPCCLSASHAKSLVYEYDFSDEDGGKCLSRYLVEYSVVRSGLERNHTGVCRCSVSGSTAYNHKRLLRLISEDAQEEAGAD